MIHALLAAILLAIFGCQSPSRDDASAADAGGPDAMTGIGLPSAGWNRRVRDELWLVGGQSNALGRANAADLPADLQAEQTDVLYAARGYELPGHSSTLYDVPWGSLAPIDDTHGPEITFGRARADAGHRVAIVKFAVGGASLAQHWLSEGRYEQSLAYYQARIAEYPRRYRIAGLFWIQGETDANNAAPASNYAANLTTMMARYRADLDVPGLPLVFTQLHASANLPHRNTVRARQDTYDAADPLAFKVNIDDQTLDPDLLHHPSLAAQVNGQRAAALP